MSGAASSLGISDITTQAYSMMEDEDKSVRSHPFKNFYTSNEPVLFKS